MNHKEKFIELATQVAEGGSLSNVFHDFLKIAATSLASFDRTDKDTWQEREKLFQSTIGRYGADKQKIFVDMLSELGLGLNECLSQESRYRDVLGELFHEFNLNERKNGQVFTPQHIGNLMGDLALNQKKLDDEISQYGFVTIVEPCCGSGAITLGALNSLLNLGISPNHQCRIIANDLDERCVFMAYIQFSLYGIPAIVTQKDALSEKTLGASWQTIQYKKIAHITG